MSEGVITGEIISVRFSFSGTVSKVAVTPGIRIKRGQLLASLDRAPQQLELDRELKDYDRIRADFEIFVQKQGGDVSDIARYEKIRQQSLLDVSVKNVELAKARLDQSDLISPVEGLVVSDGGLRPGLHITPGANPVEILDLASLVFTVPVEWGDLAKFPPDSRFTVRLTGISDDIPATVLPFLPPADPKKAPQINFRLETDLPLFPGLPGKLLT